MRHQLNAPWRFRDEIRRKSDYFAPMSNLGQLDGWTVNELLQSSIIVEGSQSRRADGMG
jgi:hypothetical protein